MFGWNESIIKVLPGEDRVYVIWVFLKMFVQIDFVQE